jgi:tetratricopeptide (TPR) repeat protein
MIRLNPNNITSFYYRGLLKAELKDFRGALEDLNKTIELYPGHAEAYVERSAVRMNLKDRPGALEDLNTAERLGRVPPDSLTAGKKDYLKSLVSLTGDFEEMNTPASKFQNQSIDIQLLPMFHLIPGKTGYDRIYLYDTYQKKHYHTTILTLTNHAGLISDSVYRMELLTNTFQIDSLVPDPQSYLRRGVAFAALRRYDLAIRDFDASLQLDSGYVLDYFSRANVRFELIQLINDLNDYQHQITIGQSIPVQQEQILTTDMVHTYENVIHDYDRALELDSGFFFAFYNRGYVYSMMGLYARAVDDFSHAIGLKRNFPEALYNRGLMLLLLNRNAEACEDLSRAGELGIEDAYKVIKRYCYK